MAKLATIQEVKIGMVLTNFYAGNKGRFPTKGKIRKLYSYYNKADFWVKVIKVDRVHRTYDVKVISVVPYKEDFDERRVSGSS